MHLLPIAWQYFKEIMSMIQVDVRNGIRTEKVILPQLMKASIKHKVIIEKITIQRWSILKFLKGYLGDML